MLILKKKKKTLWLLFMDGVQLPQGMVYRLIWCIDSFWKSCLVKYTSRTRNLLSKEKLFRKTKLKKQFIIVAANSSGSSHIEE